MFWHIETDIICLIILLILFYDLSNHKATTMYQDKVFRIITFVSIIEVIIDIFASLAMEYSTNWFVYEFMMVIYFAALLALPLLWYYYTLIIIYAKLPYRYRYIMAIAAAPAIIFALISLSNPISNLLFSLSDEMVYTRGPLFSLGILLLVFYSLLTIATVIRLRKQIVPRSRAWLFVSFFLLVGAGVAAQLSFPGLLLINASYTIVLLISHYYIQNRRTLADSLTGLLNRGTGEQRVSDYIDSHEIGGSGAFIITDLDNFKTINDTMGHQFGDTVLQKTADVFREIAPSEAILCRLGGDEFLILFDIKNDKEALADLLDKVNPLLQNRLKDTIPSGTRQITVSMGVALFPEHGSNFAELYENADIALYQAKWSGRNRSVLFDPETSIKEHARMITAIDNVNERMSTEPRVKTILVVDDSETDQEIIANVFKNDYIILRADDCASALRLMRRYGTSISLVILDLMMPGKNGFDFLCEKSRNAAIKNIPVMVITASSDAADKTLALQYGAAEVLVKPIDPEKAKMSAENILSKYSMGFWYNESYQRELMNLANIGITGGVFCVSNEPPDYPIDYVSHSLVKLLGFDSLQQLLDSVDGCWSNCLVPEDLSRIKSLLRDRLLQGHEYMELEYHLRCSDGTNVLIRDNGKLIIGEDGSEFIIGLCIVLEKKESAHYL